MSDPIDQFREAMESHGVGSPPEIEADGKLHRFDGPDDRKGRESGWYVLHSGERMGGAFGSWKSGVNETWVQKTDRKLTAKERKELELRLAEGRAQREAEQARVYAEAAARAEELLRESTAPDPSHPYLVAKAIRPNSLRQLGDSLVVALRTPEGELSSLQFIDASGGKKFLPCGRKRGCYATIRRPESGPVTTLLVCEGYATGASIHAATDLTVCVAFDAGNLAPVVEALRKKYPAAMIVVCADNDQWKPKNVGLDQAREAAKAWRASLAVPEFKHASETNPLTDFNDLAQSEGLGRVAEIIEASLSSAIDGAVNCNKTAISVSDAGRITMQTDDQDGVDIFAITSGVSDKHSAVAAELAEATKGQLLFDELRQRFYLYERVWRPMTEGDIKRRVQLGFDNAISGGYNLNFLTSVFQLFKLRVGCGRDRPVNWNQRGYVPMQNGLFNLQSGALEAFDRTKRIDWILPYGFDADAECPTFDILIERLSGGDAASHRLLVVFLAAIIRCRADLQKYLELVGLAGSGKSSYMHVAQMLVGSENVVSSNMRQLGQNRFETAGLYGKRLAIFPDEKDHVAEGTDVFKAITGGDRLRFEQKGQQQGETFRFDGLVIVSCNSPMTFEDYSGAIPRRRMSVHIDYTLRDKDRDPNFMAKLALEMPGVINRIVKISDEEIESVLLDTRGERTVAAKRSLIETNPVYDWFNHRVVLEASGTSYVGSLNREHGALVGAGEYLYPNFIEWLELNGRRGTLSLRKFVSTLRELVRSLNLPVTPGAKTKHGVPWLGVKIRGDQHGGHKTPITDEVLRLF